MLEFDRVVILNLKRRPDRLARVTRHLAQAGGELFRDYTVVEAVDGHRLPVPYGWGNAGPGAWGCMESHRRILERAILDRVGSLLVLEDDAQLVEFFPARFGQFAAAVPDDWRGLMLGGQHVGARPPLPVSPGVVRALCTQRTHAYAVRGQLIAGLYQHLVSTSGHCDHRMSELHPRGRWYAPEPFLIGQAPGESDIDGRKHEARFWAAPGKALA